VSTVLVWSIAIGAIAGVLFRPREWPEAIWSCLGAALLVVCRLISVPKAGAAIAKGADVYLFLTGMMMLAELARQKGVFDWLAGLAALTIEEVFLGDPAWVVPQGQPAGAYTLKLGVFTSLVGTPFFFWLVLKLKRTSP